jgi:hypothetical protein
MEEPSIEELKRRSEVNELKRRAANGEHITLGYSLIDPKTDPGTQIILAKFQLIYSTIALVLGLVCIVGGIVLFLNGVAGATSWTASVLGAESKISDAAPGAVLFVVGLFIVYITRYRFKHK